MTTGGPADDRDAVLTTGANSGIGLATVIEVAKRGYRSFGSVRSVAKADVVHRAAAEAGVEVETVILDVTDADACAAVIDDLDVDLFGLVNNAGYGMTGAIEDVTDEEAHHLFETMVFAPLRLARLVLPAMRNAGRGRIINVSSIYGRTTTPLTGWYQGAKHALEGASDALRLEVAGAGVQVVLIEPGGFKTGIWEDLERDITKRGDSRYGNAYRRTQQAMLLSSPIMGEPKQCAKVIANALSSKRPRARYLVGIDAMALATVERFTPTALKDRVVRLTLGL
jgi:NAD(P)-dependent dehydrogenase (short-subunit alcohol dehydrogenase family)